MKRLLVIPVMIFALLSACNHNDDSQDEPLPLSDPEIPKSIFKIVYTQNGDIANFIKTLSLGEGFIIEATKIEVPKGLFNDDLKESSYTFLTKDKLESVELSVSSGWLPTTKNPSAMTIQLDIYRDNKIIDSQKLSFTSQEVVNVFQFKYNSK